MYEIKTKVVYEDFSKDVAIEEFVGLKLKYNHFW